MSLLCCQLSLERVLVFQGEILGIFEEFIKERDSIFLEGVREVAKRLIEKHNISVKGALNEKRSRELIIGAFGNNDPKFPQTVRKPIGYGGDHIFEWNGYRIMWEDKDHKETVRKSEVEKAVSDFDNHPECDILLFVSARTGIFERIRPIDLDTSTGRPVIFISHFYDNPDPTRYIRALQPFISQSIVLLRNDEKTQRGSRERRAAVDAIAIAKKEALSKKPPDVECSEETRRTLIESFEETKRRTREPVEIPPSETISTPDGQTITRRWLLGKWRTIIP